MLEARGIKQVLAWDITLLPSPIIGRYYYLYMVMDVWSRRILGVEVHGEQSGKLAGEFFDRICRDEKINKESAAVLHSDNGAPMRSFTLAAKMAELGISHHSQGQGSVIKNAFAESIFRDILSVREWVDQFIAWYNTEHRHSGIKYVTPNQHHFGLADDIC